ncbi:hypothetical protein EGJ27_10670 [Pseudomonas sp. v388]|uniref:hypothetical protein n=1 Tax=Pseudomonas sp. v388 TaxID=2479849 RepID=UPI000F793C55|nr:hypothetical protein [Pseudomonas sp. v388]RRV08497.1 hypothetical protein EGJ27_10670 [Pseudomonas sp. v388]
MNHAAHKQGANGLLLLAIAAIFVVGNFLWQGHDGFNLWDEGYLWYGARQLLAGDIPIRDFMAYDPGRYYWSAGFFLLCGDDGIIPLRIAVAAFQTFGMYAGLWTISVGLRQTTAKNVLYLCIAAITLMTWMYPRHKIFDISISMMIVAGITYLLINPVAVRYFLLGALVGLAAVFGRNHGVYGVAASLLAFIWLMIRTSEKSHIWRGFGAWATGVIVGYTPVLIMCLVIPGYLGAFVETIIFMLQQGNTNLPLPIPWPWTVGFGTAGYIIETRWFLIGICFMALLAFGVGTLGWIFRERLLGNYVRPELIAAACTALPYAHFAFARADLGHLAQAIYPLLLGLLISVAALTSWSSRLGLSVLTASVSLFILAAWQPGFLARTQEGWRQLNVSGSTLSMDASTAEAVELLRNLTARYAAAGRSVLVLPFWPGAYALLDRRAPLWEIYALSPRPEEFQRTEIQRIKKADPGFALIMNVAMDGREELRFSNSHQLVNEYIRTHFETVPDSPNPAYEIYKSP